MPDPAGQVLQRAGRSTTVRFSAPSWIRTSGLLLRRESLYPAELSGLDHRIVELIACSIEVLKVCEIADHPPGVDGQPTDQHELDACLREPAKELIEGRFGQRGRAVPTNCISL